MSDELKECPFCGVKLSIENWGDVDFDVTHEDEPEARRMRCPLACSYDYSSMQSAVKAANMRYERTCEMKPSHGTAWSVCSNCGAFVYSNAVTNITNNIPVRYCPACGAKVVE